MVVRPTRLRLSSQSITHRGLSSERWPVGSLAEVTTPLIASQSIESAMSAIPFAVLSVLVTTSCVSRSILIRESGVESMASLLLNVACVSVL